MKCETQSKITALHKFPLKCKQVQGCLWSLEKGETGFLVKNETRSWGNLFLTLLQHWDWTSFPVFKLGMFPNTGARSLQHFSSQLCWAHRGEWLLGLYLRGSCCSLSPLLLGERAGKRCPAGEQWPGWHPWRKSVWCSSAGHRSCGWHRSHGQEGHLRSGTDVTESKQSCSFEQWPGSKQKNHTQRRVKQFNLLLVYNPLAPAVSSVMI